MALVADHLHRAAGSTPVFISTLNADLRYEFVSEAYASWLGVERDALVGQHLRDVLGEEFWAQAGPEMTSATRGESAGNGVEASFNHATRGNIHSVCFPSRDASRRVVGFLALIFDFNEQKRLERALGTSEERFRVALQCCSPLFVFNQDLDLRYTWVSTTKGSWLPELPLGKRDSDVMEHSEDAEALEAIKRGVLHTGVVMQQCIVIRSKGKEVVYDLTVEPLRDLDGDIIGITGAATDITRLRLAERERREDLEHRVAERTAELERSEAKLRAILETVGEVIISTSERGVIESCNRAIEPLLGYTPAEVLGQDVGMLMPEPTRSMHEAYLVRYLETQNKHVLDSGREVVAQAKSGKLVPLRLEVAETVVAGERKFVGTLRDLRPERRARATQRYQARLVDHISDAVISTGLDFKIRSWNPAAERIYGFPAQDVLGKDVWKVLATDGNGADANRAKTQLLETGSWQGEVKQRHRDGSQLHVRSTVSILTDDEGTLNGSEGALAGLVAVNADVTAMKQLQLRLRMSEKLEALGTLASGVAHDFNNLLMGIIGCADIGISKLAWDHPARSDIERLRDSAYSGTVTVRELMSFGHTSLDPTPAHAAIDEVIERVRGVARSFLTEEVEFEMNLCAPGLHVSCDPGHLEQSVLNLLANSRQAMPRGGTVRVTTAEVIVDDTFPGVAPGRYGTIAVSDDGVGMDAETKARIFEPFFTTRDVGEGTGLGLSNVYSTAKRSGGDIFVDSQPGVGSTFTIYLPAAEKRSPDRNPTTESAHDGLLTVLVVEDNRLVRLSVKHYLEQAGHRVLDAGCSEEAMSLSKGHEGKIDLLLSDIIMPGLSGPQLSRELLEERPGLRVLYMSAHPRETLVAEGRLNGGEVLLQKPFGADDLLTAVKSDSR